MEMNEKECENSIVESTQENRHTAIVRTGRQDHEAMFYWERILIVERLDGFILWSLVLLRNDAEIM